MRNLPFLPLLAAALTCAVSHAQGSDDCSSAQPISGEGLFAFDNSGATRDGQPDPLCTPTQIERDVWFAWTASASGVAVLATCGQTSVDTMIAAYAGTACPTGPALACNDDACGVQTRIEFQVAAGATYLLRVGTWTNAVGGTGAFTMTIVSGSTGDECSNALVLGLGSTPFDTTGATTSFPWPCANGGSDVWFRFTAPETEDYMVETCPGTAYDSALEVFSGDCANLVSLACNDDSCGLQSRVNFSAVRGSDYYVRVGGFASNTGTGVLTVGEGQVGCSDPPVGPDVIVGNITGSSSWGSVGSIAGYSLGATACNVGDSTMPWEGPSNQHPVIAQNLYRLENGRIEQLGMSWLKHGFASATENYCCVCQNPGSGQIMGIGCADTYGSGLNGSQPGIGPRSEVNPTTGYFPWPFSTQGQSGDAIYKRLQVRHSDMDPALHPGALYFAEVQYVTPSDSAVGNHYNNASYRPVQISGSPQSANLNLVGATVVGEPAVAAWKAANPAVELHTVDDPDGGRFYLASLATDLGGGSWSYEYALFNLNSDLAAGRFGVPLDPSIAVSALGFHDVDYHSGEPYDGSDWGPQAHSDRLEWNVRSAAPTANALRWGTTYNFRFVADRAPRLAEATIGLFEVNSPQSNLIVAATVPEVLCEAVSYCVGAPNSAGAGARMGLSGSTSLTQNDLVLLVAGGIPNQFGLFFYGPDPAQVPQGGGFVCVGGGQWRLYPAAQANGSGAFSRALDLTQPPLGSGGGMVSAGSTWRFQLWYRDPGGPGGSGYNFSDGLAVTFCP